MEKGVKNELEVNSQQVVKRIKASKRAPGRAVWTTCGATELYNVYVATECDRGYRDERMKRCNNAKNVNMAASSWGVKNPWKSLTRMKHEGEEILSKASAIVVLRLYDNAGPKLGFGQSVFKNGELIDDI